ncbi:Chromosome partition protein Smc [Polystyrenella longa]|uniref:Chromosome partition protein Smc n=1 Tax=Polystyrenella longa TaxID=2528007 RepID=A0A518CL98_9PLAN|nr:hypothetical protein [Polystyrenella longa]QDU79996.1 Chromosome partition protein Smc [Polystyrenella longa]
MGSLSNPFRNVRIRYCCFALTVGALLLACYPSVSTAQLPVTTLHSIAPLGDQAGTTVEVTLASGDEVADVTSLIFNHPGITAQPKMQGEGEAAKPVPLKFLVNIAADVPAGTYEVRAEGFFGISNPRRFAVSNLKEFPEAEPNNSFDVATAIELEGVANGAIHAAGEIDCFKFEGKQGQRILAFARAAQLDSRLNAVTELYDANHKRIGFARNNKKYDALVDVVLPADGTYFLKLFDLQFLGSIDHGYRVTVSTAPYIDFVIPASIPPNQVSEVTLYGRNLPGGTASDQMVDGQPLEILKVQITAPEKTDSLPENELFYSSQYDVDGFTYRFQKDNLTSNPVTMYYADAPVGFELEPNDTLEKAQAITIPGEYTGQFQNPGDSDYFTFDATQGAVYYVEVYGQRNGSDADPTFVIEQLSYDAEGKESVKRITLQDDNATELLSPGFTTKTQDPVFRFEVPATGKYRLLVRDRFFDSRGQSEFVYRLAIRPESPDFKLVAVPMKTKLLADATTETGTLSLRKGENLELMVLAGRRDGYAGPIDIQVEGLPAGVTYEIKPVPGNANQFRMILSSATDAAIGTAQLKITGSAHIENPDAIRQLAATQSAVKQQQEALQKQQTELTAKQEAATAANQKIAAAVTAVKAKPEDAEVQKQLIATVQGAATAEQEVAKAQAAVTSVEQAVAQAQEKVKQAETHKQEVSRDVVRTARTGTIAWNTLANVPVIPRLARTLYLSVIDESAPYQIKAEQTEIVLHQGQQFFLPLAVGSPLAGNVELTLAGLDKNQKLTADVVTLTKDQSAGHFRFYAAHDAPAAEYTYYLKSKSTFGYRKHLARMESLQKQQAEQATTIQQSDAALKASLAKVEETTKAVADATTGKATTDQQLVASQTQLKELQAAQTAAQEREKEFAQLSTDLAGVGQQAKASLDRIALLSKNANNEELANSLNATSQQTDLSLKQIQLAVESAQNTLKVAQANSANAAKGVEAQVAAIKTAETAVQTSQKNLETAEANKQAAVAAQQKADADLKAVQAAKVALDEQVKAADAVAKPANIEIYPPSNYFKVTVKPAPAQLTATPADSGQLKQGGEVSVKVNVVRTESFKGPVKLELVLPPGKTGITSDPIELTPEQTEAALILKGTADLAEGDIANVAIRGTADADGPAHFDAVFNLKVIK